MTTSALPPLTRKDFQTDQEVRWCPGCGDYAILAAVQSVFPELGIRRENFVIVSGIGCSSRFPYYMNTFGFHSIHGRAPAVASGIKIAHPELEVWIATGDGDALAIGGNHTIHLLRRNVGIKVLLFNNRIYGLTKGQYSPTSEFHKVTKSTPFGSPDRPFNPVSLAIGAESTFVARSVDIFQAHLKETLKAAAAHKGSAFVEILQNCNIFNDGAWVNLTEKDARSEHVIQLEHGKPLIFGKARDKGIRRKPDGDILAMRVIEEIHRKLPSTHLVMHGSSSVPEDLQEIINANGGKMKPTWGVPVSEIQRGIKNGVRKINIDTDNRMAMTGQIRKVLTQNPEEFDPRKYLKPAMEAMTKLCKQRLQEFNTAGQASKIKKVLTTAEMAKRYSKGELDPRVA